MKRQLLLSMALLVASTAQATITRVQSKPDFAKCRGTSVVIEFPKSTSAGDLFVVWTAWASKTTITASVMDSLNNSFSTAVGPTTHKSLTAQVFYATNGESTGKDEITITYSGSPAACGGVIVEYSGIRSAHPIDTVATNIGFGEALDSGYADPGFVSELIFGAGATTVAGKNTPGNGFREIEANGQVMTEDEMVFANTPQHANASASGHNGYWIMQMVTFVDSGDLWSGNFGIHGGPRPYADVTAYGAHGDGVRDDTAAIQAAINAACQNAPDGGGVIFFPPTSKAYFLTQPQNPSTAPVLNLSSCTSTGVTFEGGGSPGGAQQQFARSPMTRIGVLKLGSSPNLAPVFLVGAGNNLVTFRNLSIYGYNQAIQVNNSVGLVLENMALAVGNAQNGATNCTTVDCTSDNTPLAIYSSFWIWANQTALEAGPTGGYAAVFANANSANTTGLVRFDKVSTAGGGFLFDQRDASAMATGNYEFHTVSMEGGGASPFFTMLNTNGGTASRNIGPFVFENSAAYDCTNATPFFRMNAAHVNLATLLIKNSDGCNASPPLQVQAGSAYNVVVEGNSFESRIPVDENGDPLGPAETQSQTGRDYITPTGDTNRLRTDYTNCCGVGTGSDGSPIRMAPSGSVQATVALDPGQAAGQGGLLFGDGVNAGYNADLVEQTSGGDDTLDVAFAQATAPAGLSATAGSSGSCKAGTYYYVVTAYSGSTATTSTASNEANATVGANGSVALKWTLAMGPNITGYQITRSTISGGEFSGGKQYEVTGAGANSFTDTCASTSSGSVTFWNQTFAAFHRFSQRKLGVDNLSPAAQLDVLAQDPSTVGFSVKAAASPATNIWQVLDSAGATQACLDNGFNFVTAGHENRTSANSDAAGTLTITSSSSGTKTFAAAYSNAPACVASPQSNLGTTTWWVTTTASAMTISLSASSTVSFFYGCAGNPN